MDRQGALKMLGIIKAAYPMSYKNMSRTDAEAAAALWQEVFKEVDEQQAAVALKCYIAEDKAFPPAPGEIMERVRRLNKYMNVPYGIALKEWMGEGYYAIPKEMRDYISAEEAKLLSDGKAEKRKSVFRNYRDEDEE
jgi:hypothetical protein